MLMCFFLAMLVTNDVSLLTLVPLTIALFRSMPEVCIRTVVLETAAANPTPWLPRWGIRRTSIFTAFQHAGRGFLPGNAAQRRSALRCSCSRADYPPQ
ncbi:MAG: hypothetical protein ACLSG5_10310 [Oscillospiraceae bacterium]